MRRAAAALLAGARRVRPLARDAKQFYNDG
jgi:hypothetical protein